jgi:uncharacterized protein (TIGR02996 family)
MSDEDAFQAAIDANERDWTLRAVFADWLEDRGDVRAAWYRVRGYVPGAGCVNDVRCRYWCLNFYIPSGADLPEDLFNLLEVPGKGDTFAPSWHLYDDPFSRRQCDDAAAYAFAKIPAERQAELIAGSEVTV